MHAVIEMTMSVFLLIVLAILLAGAIVTELLARYGHRYARQSAVIAEVVVLLIWIVAGRSLPLTIDISGASRATPFTNWTWQVDEAAWQLSLTLLLLVVAVLIVAISRFGDGSHNGGQSTTGIRLPTIVLLLTAITLAALWSTTSAGLISSWALLALVWLLLMLSTEEGEVEFAELFLRTGALALGTLFLWLAAATLGQPIESQLDPAEWPLMAKFWVVLAAAAQLGALPLQWWRPLRSAIPPTAAALIHLVPAIAGASLLARIAISMASEPGLVLFVTGMGLLGIVAGVILAWMDIDRPTRVASALALGQVGLILLLATWNETQEIVAGTKVLILGTGSLFLVAEWPRALPAWLKIGPILSVAALAGLPLTAGFNSMAALYDAWILKGSVVLVLVTVLLYVPTIAVALLIVLHEGSGDNRPSPNVTDRVGIGVALLLLGMGLLSVPAFPLGQIEPLSWIAILVAAVGGMALGFQRRQVSKVQEALGGVASLRPQFGRAYAAISTLVSTVATAVRETAAIMEGEGGMMWLLVLIVIFWLARRG